MWPHLVPGGGCSPLPRAGQCPLCATLGALGAPRPPPLLSPNLPQLPWDKIPSHWAWGGAVSCPLPALCILVPARLPPEQLQLCPLPTLGPISRLFIPTNSVFSPFFPPKFPSLLQPHSGSYRSSQGSAHSWVWGFWQLLPPFPLGRGFARTEISGQLEEADLYFRDGSSHRVL